MFGYNNAEEMFRRGELTLEIPIRIFIILYVQVVHLLE